MIDGRQQFIETRARLHFRSQRRHLRPIQSSPFQIGRQAIHAAGHVPEMKAQRRQSMRASPHLAGGEPRGVPRQILARLLKPVERRRDQGIDLRQRPAQPRFRKIAAMVPAQFFFSAFLRCRFSGTGIPIWLRFPVMAEASLFNVPS